ncbi:MAG: hypothetical protein QXG03_13240 [Halalkalicoccus sp.]
MQLRLGFSTDRGEVTRFFVQLEYWLDGDWREVVRYDHDATAAGGHDITAEGLHRDVYRDGEKVAVKRITLPIPADEGFNYAEADLKENAQRYINRFERWHDINDRTSP